MSKDLQTLHDNIQILNYIAVEIGEKLFFRPTQDQVNIIESTLQKFFGSVIANLTTSLLSEIDIRQTEGSDVLVLLQKHILLKSLENLETKK